MKPSMQGLRPIIEDTFVDFALAGFLDRQLPAIFSATSRAIRGTHPSNTTKLNTYMCIWRRKMSIDWQKYKSTGMRRRNWRASAASLQQACSKQKISAGSSINNHGIKRLMKS
jgi:hypothetical protein